MSKENTLQAWRDRFGDSLEIIERPNGDCVLQVEHTIACHILHTVEALEFSTPEITAYRMDQVERAMALRHLEYSGEKGKVWEQTQKLLEAYNEQRRTNSPVE